MDLELVLTKEQIEHLGNEFGEYTWIGDDMVVIPCERMAEKRTSFGEDFDFEDEDAEYPIFELLVHAETREDGKYNVTFETNTDYDFNSTEISILDDALHKEIMDILK